MRQPRVPGQAERWGDAGQIGRRVELGAVDADQQGGLIVRTRLQVELDPTDRPTYRFVPGVARTSLAQKTAVRHFEITKPSLNGIFLKYPVTRGRMSTDWTALIRPVKSTKSVTSLSILRLLIPIVVVTGSLWGAGNIPTHFQDIGVAVLSGYSADSLFRNSIAKLSSTKS